MENDPFIVDFPIKNSDFPWQNVSSPEGIQNFSTKQTRQLEMDWSQENNTENGCI